MKKIIKKIGNQLISFLATFSLIINLSQPLLIVYAEDLSTEEGTVEEVSSEDETTGEESASEEEPAAEEEPVEEEEATVEEEPAVEEQEDELASDNPEDAAIEVIEEGTPEEVIEEPADEEPVTEEPAAEGEQVLEEDLAPVDAEGTNVEEEESTVCFNEDEPINSSTESDWAVDEEKAETVNKVELGKKYEFPLNTEVSVTFTCLPTNEEQRSNLKIERIAIEELNLPEGYMSATPYAYDIDTDMEEGSFVYELTLPNDEMVDTDVSYIEKEKDEEITKDDIKDIEEEKIEGDDSTVTVKDLDHFSIWIVWANLTLFPEFSGATQVIAYPGESVQATLRVGTDGSPSNNNWQSLRYAIEGQSPVCLDGPNFGYSGYHSYNFSVTAPSTVGIYDISFRAYGSNGCSGGSSGVETLTNGITVVSSTAIPFFESFGTSESNSVPDWPENEPAVIHSGSGENAPIDGKYAKIGEDGFICRAFSAVGLNNLALSYFWNGDEDAESNDYGRVEYQLGTTCDRTTGWTELERHRLSDMSWNNESYDLPNVLDNKVFSLRFRNDASQDDEYFRVDSVSIATKTGSLEVTKVVDWSGTSPNTGRYFQICVSPVDSDSRDCKSIDYDGGVLTWDNLASGSYRVLETNPGGEWTVLIESETVGVAEGQVATATVTNTFIPPTITINAYKIMCDDESYLPNWGRGGSLNGRQTPITQSIAQNWVDTSEGHCYFEPSWLFQWGTPTAPNPGDNTGVSSNPKWHTFGPTDSSGLATVSLSRDEVTASSNLWMREVWQEGYIPFTYGIEGGNSNNVSAEMYCHVDALNYDNWDRIDKVSFGETYTCIAWNVPTGDIHGYKWLDSNADGDFNSCDVSNTEVSSPLLRSLMTEIDPQPAQECEELLGDWTIYIDENLNGDLDDGEPRTTTEDDPQSEHFGWYWFEDLIPGTYRVCEIEKEGWQQTYPARGGCHDVTIPDNNPNRFAVSQNAVYAPEYPFGNVPTDVELQITKSNDTGGTPVASGDSIIFTMTIKALRGSVFGVNLTDLLPDNIKYMSSSWTGTSSVHGNLAGLLTEPTYASPGTWSLGEIEENEVITLTYIGTVQDGTDSGKYKDLAWAKGENIVGDTVLAVAVPADVGTNFVGTDVLVLNYIEPDAAEIDVEENKIVVGEVLGASTFLPATGSDTNWIYAAFIALIIGLVNILMGVLLMKKKITLPKFSLGMKVFGLVILGAFIFSPKANAAALLVRIEEPAATANRPFGITFVVQDLLDRQVSAQCFMQRPSEGGFSDFGPVYPLGSGGDSEICDVTSSELTEEGSYKFKVVATAADSPDEVVDSDEVTVDYDGEGPERPRHIEVNKVNSCKYEIEVKTHSDGGTAKIEVYADDDLNIEVNDGSKIKDYSMGPDEEYDFDYEVYGTDCDKDWFFATRAFDSFGNPSDVRVQEVDDIETITTETTDEGTEVTEGAIPTEGGSILGEQTGEEGSVVGEVLGEGTESEDATMGEEVTDDLGGGLLKSKVFWAVLILLALVLLNVLRKKIKNQKK